MNDFLYRYTEALAEKTTNKIGIGNLVQPKIFLGVIDGPTRAVGHARLHFKIPDWQNSEGRQLSLSRLVQYIESCQHRIEIVLGF